MPGHIPIPGTSVYFSIVKAEFLKTNELFSELGNSKCSGEGCCDSFPRFYNVFHRFYFIRPKDRPNTTFREESSLQTESIY